MTSFEGTVVITTIQRPTECMRVLARRILDCKLSWIVIGDRKGPDEFELEPAELVSLEQQRELPFRLALLLPEESYARKNVGYLLAISRGSKCIYETDDDNAPTDEWRVRNPRVLGHRISRKSTARWANVYGAATSELIWPRGLPLNTIRRAFSEEFDIEASPVQVLAPIQQGLADGSPDVDAIWRLILDREITFNRVPNLLLPRGIWCPFNAQNTWWWAEAFPLLYLPSYCSFRMTDIWRSLVAQRCLWELGYELEFHCADVKQTRNTHDLLVDFEQETPGYLHNEPIREALENCELSSDPSRMDDNLVTCYEALIRKGFVGGEEIQLLQAWADDMERATNARQPRSAGPLQTIAS